MGDTNIKYAADAALAVTAWSTSLAPGQSATSAIFDNSSNLYPDVQLGGVLELDATTPVAGDTLDIYVVPQYSDTATDMAGGIDALFDAATEEVADTAFVLANLKKLDSISVEATIPATAQGYHWAGSVVAALGYMPKKFMLLLHNNTAGTLATGSDVNVRGVEWTST